MVFRRGWCGLMMGWIGCAAPSPETALEAYRAAVSAQDVERVHERSAAAIRASYTTRELEAQLEPAMTRLASEVRAVRQTAEVQLENGAVIHMVLEDGVWRVASGGVPLFETDTPNRALDTFFRAIQTENLAVLRRVIPRTHAAQYETDAALRTHLERIRPRVDAAWAILKEGRIPKARIDGHRASLTYGPGRTIRFVRDPDGWRILDLE